jgi:HSP20 family protein
VDILLKEVINMSKTEHKSEMAEATGKDTRKTTPVRALSPFEEMERLFGSMFPRARMRPLEWEWPSWGEMTSLVEAKLPKLDIIERDDEVLVRAELAGVDKKDIDVSVTDTTVSIKGSTKKETKEEKGDYFRSEISRGSFSRMATLPCEVDGTQAKATFSDGILELTIPKLQASKRHSVKVD